MAFKNYNPNPQNNLVIDCTVRAISKVTGQSWDETYIGLAVQGYESNGTNVWPNYYSQMNDTRTGYRIPQMPMNSYAPPQVKSNIKWVSGRGEAESTPVGPNETILMLDSSTTKMYIKSAGPDGRINPLMVCDYTVSEAEFQNGGSQTAPQIDTSQFATKEDFNQLKQMVESMSKSGGKNG